MKKVLFNQKYLCTYLLISLLCGPSYNSYLPVVDMDPAVHLSTHLLSYLPTINKYLPTTVITCLTFLAIHTSQLTNYLLFCLLFIKLLKIVLICHANPKSEPVLGFEIMGTSFLSGIKAICLSPLPFDSVPDPWLQCHLQDGGVPGGLR